VSVMTTYVEEGREVTKSETMWFHSLKPTWIVSLLRIETFWRSILEMLFPVAGSELTLKFFGDSLRWVRVKPSYKIGCTVRL